MNIKDMINRKPETVGYLVKALLDDTYSGEGRQFFLDMFNKQLSEDDLDGVIPREIRETTAVHVDCIAQSDTQLYIDCYFKGHGGYPGATDTKDITMLKLVITPALLTYLMVDMANKIERAKTAYMNLVNCDEE
jgi:hypothetical protein